MTGSGQRRGVIVRDLYLYGDPGKALDPARVEAERAHVSKVTGFDIRYVHFDRLFIADRAACHRRFLEEVAAAQPEFIWCHPHTHFNMMNLNVRAEILCAARMIYGPRLILSFGDIGYDLHTACSVGYASIADISVVWDGNGARLAELLPGKTVLDLWTPVDERVFRDPGLERDVDVCFAGAVRHYPDRRETLAALASQGVPVVVQGGEHGERPGIDDYVGLLRRAKISLNFSRTTDGGHQLKGRVLESILSGALLFESENAVTPRYLTPYHHYVPFGDVADLTAKIRRYLADDAARAGIVAAAKARVSEHLSETVWWRRIVEALDRTWIEMLQRQQGSPSP